MVIAVRRPFVNNRLMHRVEPDLIGVLRVLHGRRVPSNVPGSSEEAPRAGGVAPERRLRASLFLPASSFKAPPTSISA
jgi:hypothetical protein